MRSVLIQLLCSVFLCVFRTLTVPCSVFFWGFFFYFGICFFAFAFAAATFVFASAFAAFAFAFAACAFAFAFASAAFSSFSVFLFLCCIGLSFCFYIYLYFAVVAAQLRLVSLWPLELLVLLFFSKVFVSSIKEAPVPFNARH